MTDYSKSPATLVLIPTPGMGHLIPAMELAKMLVARDPCLSVSILLIKPPETDEKLDFYILSLKSDPSLLNNDNVLSYMPVLEPIFYKPGYLTLYMECYKSEVKDVVEGLRAAGPIRGLILDLFCAAMFDVADDLGIPPFLFFTYGANLLSMMFHLRGLGVDVSKEYDVVRSPDIALPGFRNTLPVGVLPGFFLKHDGNGGFLRHVETYRQAKGILVYTFTELEQDLIQSLSQDCRIPQVYTVGPLINVASDDESSSEDPIMRWLDTQPTRSVVFLCFGSRSSFDDTQVKEIAVGLERRGQRFLLSLQLRPENRGDPASMLPEGFLEPRRARVLVQLSLA